MQVKITGRHVEVTENIKQHIHDKLDQCLSVFPRVESVHVILDLEKREHVAEVVIQAANHIRLTAKEKSENMYDSIDRAVEHAERQLRKQRDKVQDHHK
jgi:putative sigma-54 modulation protein